MVGRLVAGCDESPGIAFNKDGKFIKIYRGMAGCKQYIYRSGSKFIEARENWRVGTQSSNIQLRRSVRIYPLYWSTPICDTKLRKWHKKRNELQWGL
jgi:hypothetical protein